MESGAIEIFFSYVDDDVEYYRKIREHLGVRQQGGRVRCWSHQDVEASQVIEDEIQRHLKSASLVVLLLSAEYLNSADYDRVETVAETRRQQGRPALIVPVLTRPCLYEDTVLGELKALPSDDRPLSQWPDLDSACKNIVDGLKPLLQKVTAAMAEPNGRSIWNVPYPRNTLFTGREAELQAIEAALREGRSAAIEAISGLGGIGKTQLALEYAYRHRQEYRYVFWVLADTRDTLSAGYLTIAELLDLPGKSQSEQRYIIAAVKSWLEKNTGWLLVLDNADDLEVLVGKADSQEPLASFLPANAPGHILLTTRSQSLGRLAERIPLNRLGEDEACRFLLSRSNLRGKLRDQADIDAKEDEAARTIVRELGGLPLALDQAGAYIEETSCGLQGYLTLFKKQRKELLKLRGGLVDDHPASVVQTVQMAFEKVEKANSSSADLLRLCAFLAPDEIPEMLIEQGEAELPNSLKKLARNPLKLNAALAALQKYSLVSRNPDTHTLDIHRLVQAVVRDSMKPNVEKAWATRIVRIMHRVFPWSEKIEMWETCRQLLPHAQECAELIARWQMETFECGRLLNEMGRYLQERAEYREAQSYLEKALGLAQKIWGKEHFNLTTSLNNLAVVYSDQGKYEQARRLYEQVLAMRRKVLGEEHPDIAGSLNNLATVYSDQGKYEQAEMLHKQALLIQSKALGEEHPDTAGSLSNLASVYSDQGKYEQALRLHERALAIQRKVLGEEHLDTAGSLDSLGLVYAKQSKPSEAESLHQQALAIRRKVLGEEHPSIAMSLNNLAEAYLGQGKYEQAEGLHRQAFVILRKVFGEEHHLPALSLNNRGEVYLAQGRYEEAENLFQQALAIQRKIWGEEHPETVRTIHNLGMLYQTQGKREEALSMFEQALAIRVKVLGEAHPDTQKTRAKCEELRQQANSELRTAD